MIPESEWNFAEQFSRGHESELTACWCYESARHFEERRQRKPAPAEIEYYWRKQVTSLPPSSAVYAKMIFDLISLGKFPSTSWLSLKKELRAEKLKEVEEYSSLLLPGTSLSTFIDLLEFEVADPAKNPWVELWGNGETLAAIRIDWSKTDKQLKEEFERLIARLQHKDRKRKGSGRRKSARDGLRALAVQRIVKACKGQTAACERFSKRDNPFCWTIGSNTREACIARSNRGKEVNSWHRNTTVELLVPYIDSPSWPQVWLGQGFLKTEATTLTLFGSVSSTTGINPIPDTGSDASKVLI